jgi:hypothetical protein
MRRKDQIHLIPDLFGVAALSVPLVLPGENTNGASAADSVMSIVRGQNTFGAGMSEAVNNTIASVKTNVVPMVELGVLAFAFAWGGKKLGLNKIGTKRVKIA